MIERSKKEDWEIIHQSRKMTSALAIGDKATASQPLPLTRRLLLRLKQRLGAEGLESGFFSPALIYIGKKTEAAGAESVCGVGR